jgi:ribosomal protein L5
VPADAGGTFGYTNLDGRCRGIEKVSVNMGLGEAVQNPKLIESR